MRAGKAIGLAARPVLTPIGVWRVLSPLRKFWRVLGIAMVLVAFCGLSAFTLLELRRDTWHQATTNTRNLVTVLSQDIARNFGAYDSVLLRTANLVGDPAVTALPPALQQKILFEETDVDRYFASLLVLDRDGNVLWSRDSFPVSPESFAGREFFVSEKSHPGSSLSISKPFRRGGSGPDDVVALSRRLDAPDGSFAGIVTGIVRLDVFRDLFATAHLGPDDALNVMSTRNILLMRQPEAPGTIGHDYSNTTNARRFMAAESGTFASPSAVDGVLRVYSFQHVSNLPLVLSVGLAETGVFALWNRLAIGVGMALAALCAMAVAISVSMRRELRRRMAAEEASRRNEARLRLLADNSTDLILRLSEDRRREYVSPASLALLGYPPEILIGRRSQDLIHPDDLAIVDELVGNARQRTGGTEGVYRLRHADGRYIWVEGRYNYVPQDRAFVVVLRDISRRKEAEFRLEAAHAELSTLARTDGLTGLANRRCFDESIEAECAPRGAASPVSLLLLDIDRFKLFNDRYGHPAGDECLRQVAAALRDTLQGETALLARYGGEELAVLLPGVGAPDAEAIAERVRAGVMSRALPHEGNAANGGVVTVSVGQATIEVGRAAQGEAASRLVAEADRWLYEAKRLGRNRVMSEAASLGLALSRPREEARIAAANELIEAKAGLSNDELDNLAATAARLLGAPIGLVSLIGETTAHAVGRHGADVTVLPREDVFCNHTIQGDAPFVVPDLAEDRRFLGNPLLEGDAPLRFYAGAPLFHPETGEAVGAVCVLDYKPHGDFDDDKRRMLTALSGIAATQFSKELGRPA